MKRSRGIILDIDGTVLRGNQVIPGATEAIAELRHQGYRIVFITNALENSNEQAERLNSVGIAATYDEIITAPQVLKAYLDEHSPDATIYVIADSPLSDELGRDFHISIDPKEIDVLIVSCDSNFNFHKLNIGFQALRRGARFIAVNADATCPLPDGEIPDAGAVIGALEGCSRRKLELVIGKPSSLAVEASLERLKLPISDCIVVGDSLESDISMGHMAGLLTVLVLSGVTRREDLPLATVQPDHVVESISKLPGLLDCRGLLS
ncbi:MAG: HAD-IIA family hydrolase [Chloroflexota bacterium]